MSRFAAIAALFAILIAGGITACEPVCTIPGQHVSNGQCV